MECKKCKNMKTHFDYWMLTEMNEILNKEYRDRFKKGGYTAPLKKISKEKGDQEAKRLLSNFENNRFESLGKVALIQKRIQEIKNEYSDAVEDTRQFHTEIEFIADTKIEFIEDGK